MDNNSNSSWKTGLPQDDREISVKLLMDALDRHTPGGKSTEQLRGFARLLEDNVFYAATNRPDYAKGICSSILRLPPKAKATPANVVPGRLEGAEGVVKSLDQGASPLMQTGAQNLSTAVQLPCQVTSQPQNRQRLVAQSDQDNLTANVMQSSSSLGSSPSGFTGISPQQRLPQPGAWSAQEATIYEPQQHQKQSAFPESSTASVDLSSRFGAAVSLDHREVVWRKLQMLRDKYLQDMKGLVVFMAKALTMPMIPEKSQKLKQCKDVLQSMVPYLAAPKENIPREFNEDCVKAFEKQIVNILENFTHNGQQQATTVTTAIAHTTSNNGNCRSSSDQNNLAANVMQSSSSLGSSPSGFTGIPPQQRLPQPGAWSAQQATMYDPQQHQKQCAFPESSTASVGLSSHSGAAVGLDHREVVWLKLQMLRDKYLQDMKELVGAMTTTITMPMTPEESQMHKHCRDALQSMVAYLTAPKENIPREFNEDRLEALEKEIRDIMDSWRISCTTGNNSNCSRSSTDQNKLTANVMQSSPSLGSSLSGFTGILPQQRLPQPGAWNAQQATMYDPQPHQKQCAFPESSTASVDLSSHSGAAVGLDHREVVWRKLQMLRDKYLQDMKELVVFMTTTSTMPMSPEESQKRKHCRDVLHSIVAYLTASKENILREFNEDRVEAFEKEIVEIMDVWRMTTFYQYLKR